MNNMLAAIMNLASALRDDLDPASPLRQDADDILRACNRGRSLTQNLLGFARRGKYRKARVNLNDVVAEVVELLARTLSKRVEVRQLLERDLADVEGDPNQLHQALVNLALNAADAMEGAGTLTFATELVELREDDLPSAPSLLEGSYVELQVSDTGVGMDEEILRSAFEPFFTTKQPGEGTGLGLSMVYGTVRSHNGQVLIESAPGEGTTVTIRFPALLPAEEDEVPEQPAGQLPRGAGTILVVDDEELVRKSTRLLLERLGYTVLLAEDGRTALERYRAHGAVDLVLLDLIMPGMDGRETYRELQALDPSVRVLFASGYADDDTVRELTAACGAPLMPKPFNLRQLAAAVASAMPDAPRPVRRSSSAPTR
jgi:CheY-like chemotaxis protein